MNEAFRLITSTNRELPTSGEGCHNPEGKLGKVGRGDKAGWVEYGRIFNNFFLAKCPCLVSFVVDQLFKYQKEFL